MTSLRLSTGILWVLALVSAAVSLAYLLPKVLDASDAQDFRLIWLAGDIWADGENPYSTIFDARYEILFGERRPSHFWVYPPYWFPISTVLSGLPFQTAALVWNLANYLFLWAGAAALVLAGGPGDPRRAAAWVVLVGALGSILHATAFTIALGQTSLMLFCGVALFVAGIRRDRSALVFLGLVLAMLKPQVGILLLTVAVLRRRTWRPAALTLIVLALAALPAAVSVGPVETVSGFVAQLATYNTNGAVPNLPEHLIGLQKILSLVGVELPSTPLILGAVAALALAGLAGVGTERLLLAMVLAALLVTGLHTYDLMLALVVLPFTRGLGRTAMAGGLVAAALMIRPSNLAAILPATDLDSSIFPGSLHATIGLALLALVMAPRLRGAGSTANGCTN